MPDTIGTETHFSETVNQYSLYIVGDYATLDELKAAHETGVTGWAANVGNRLYVWDADANDWIDGGVAVAVSAFATIKTGKTEVRAVGGADTLTLAAGQGVTLAASPESKTVTVSADTNVLATKESVDAKIFDAQVNLGVVEQRGLRTQEDLADFKKEYAADETAMRQGIVNNQVDIEHLKEKDTEQDTAIEDLRSAIEEAGQNAFSNVTDGQNTAAASAKTDTLTVKGGNGVTAAVDAASKTLTVSADTNVLATKQSVDALTEKVGEGLTGDYLPLSGGTLTGNLTIDNSDSAEDPSAISIGKKGSFISGESPDGGEGALNLGGAGYNTGVGGTGTIQVGGVGYDDADGGEGIVNLGGEARYDGNSGNGTLNLGGAGHKTGVGGTGTIQVGGVGYDGANGGDGTVNLGGEARFDGNSGNGTLNIGGVGHKTGVGGTGTIQVGGVGYDDADGGEGTVNIGGSADGGEGAVNIGGSANSGSGGVGTLSVGGHGINNSAGGGGTLNLGGKSDYGTAGTGALNVGGEGFQSPEAVGGDGVINVGGKGYKKAGTGALNVGGTGFNSDGGEGTLAVGGVAETGDQGGKGTLSVGGYAANHGGEGVFNVGGGSAHYGGKGVINVGGGSDTGGDGIINVGGAPSESEYAVSGTGTVIVNGDAAKVTVGGENGTIITKTGVTVNGVKLTSLAPSQPFATVSAEPPVGTWTILKSENGSITLPPGDLWAWIGPDMETAGSSPGGAVIWTGADEEKPKRAFAWRVA